MPVAGRGSLRRSAQRLRALAHQALFDDCCAWRAVAVGPASSARVPHAGAVRGGHEHDFCVRFVDAQIALKAAIQPANSIGIRRDHARSAYILAAYMASGT
jgi:hypothetical protein